MGETKGLFHDLLVVEFASVLAGPSVGQFFAEMGAEVYKIENLKTRGDVTRRWKLPTEPVDSSLSAYFASANWGKKSVAVDLSVEEVKDLVYALVKKADIVLSSFKPGDAEKLGMDYSTLSGLNPGLLYGQVTGYGRQVPRAGYDAVLQAEAGFMFLNGEKGGPPVKMPVALIDLMAAHQLKEGLLAALYRRLKTGLGQYVEVSLLHAAISSLANQATNYLVAGQAPVRMGSEHPNIVPYGTIFRTLDEKEIVLAVGDDRQFQALCRVLGAEELGSVALFKTNKDRVMHRQDLLPRLQQLVARHHQQELLQALIQNHVPAGAVHSIPEALAQPLVQPQLIQAEGQGPQGVRQVAFSAPEGHLPLSPPPQLGQHTWQVLRQQAEISEEDLRELVRKGCILVP
ncbi:CaiB/BaiF CoA transferase family protein [Rufibacter glacialis]|uniref:CoA transferase n=1 Tax=Rufibacter glacialis TaxID=1259555 RepID=A0A5M8Q8Q3_9BACT|nr:CaiB/BaiF CoA-transferase family protein [Rufibacter glacialis]KAA6432249.1 CoA transferase [Rufibacter glacialis]GGK77123.1 CoA transferase [Rufibacter glacialis]